MQILHYTRNITLKRVTSVKAPSPRHSAFAPQKGRSGGDSVWFDPPGKRTQALPRR